MKLDSFQMSVIITIIGLFFLFLGRKIFKFRAITNKKAWGGFTLPLIIIGLLIIGVGLILIYKFYPF